MTKESVLLIVGEQVLLTLDHSALVLSNYRVRFDRRNIGDSLYQSISLESVAYCGFVSNSQPMVLLCGLAFLCAGTAGVFVPNPIKQSVLIGTVLLLLALAFLIIYFATRSAALVIYSSCGEKIEAHRVKREPAIAFLEAVLEAKLRFNRKIIPPVVPRE